MRIAIKIFESNGEYGSGDENIAIACESARVNSANNDATKAHRQVAA